MSVKWHPWPETSPCSEYGDWYLITVLNTKTGERYVITELFDVDTLDYGFFDWTPSEHHQIIAWAEIPKPYDGAVPDFILTACNAADDRTVVTGSALRSCKKKAIDELGDTYAIKLRDYYGEEKLISTYNPQTKEWKDEQQ